MAKTDQAETEVTLQSPTPLTAQEPPKKRYRNISSTPHTLHPDGRLFLPGAEDELTPFDVARLDKVGHIWEVPAGGK
ncbi:MAG: hypothetical protein ACREDR_19535 [Blastocatellia bacterium]